MDQKLVDRLRRLAVVGMVSVLCGGSPVLAGSNPHGNPNCPGKSCEDHGNAKGHGRPNCPGKSCDSNGNPGGPIACTADADCPFSTMPKRPYRSSRCGGAAVVRMSTGR